MDVTINKIIITTYIIYKFEKSKERVSQNATILN